MTEHLRLTPGRLCWRCELPTQTGEELSAGWCQFCRAFKDEPARPVAVYRLTADKVPCRVEPRHLGDADCTGREIMAMNLLHLRGGKSVLLSTMFVCVDGSGLGRSPPLLFETELSEMNRSRIFDDFSRHYASYDDAMLGHHRAVAKLLSCRAELRA